MTEFTVTVNRTGEDYNTLTLAEAALDDAGDITDATVKCGSWDNQVGSDIADAASVTWDGGSSSGTLIHMTGTQYMLDVTAGSLADNDTVDDGGGNTFDVAGTPDSCQITIEFYDDDGDLSETVTFDGLTTDTDNFLKLTVPEGERHNGTTASGATISYTTTGTTQFVIHISDNYMVVEWLVIEITSNHRSSRGIAFDLTNGVGVLIQNNIVTSTDGSGDKSYAIYLNSGSNGLRSVEVYNNILRVDACSATTSIDCGCIFANNDFTPFNKIYNNTCYGSDFGYDLNNFGGSTFSNNISQNCGPTGCYESKSVSSSSQFNIDEDSLGTFGATWSTGTITSTSANKLIDSGATFQTDGVEVGSNVLDSTDTVRTYVTAVDSETQLSLNADIFTGSESYSIYKNSTRTVSFENTASDDYHLASGDTAAKDQGVDLGTDANVDIDGRDRDAQGDDWDIGADEFVAVGGGGGTIVGSGVVFSGVQIDG